jgi:predicted DNA binding protein
VDAAFFRVRLLGKELGITKASAQGAVKRAKRKLGPAVS